MPRNWFLPGMVVPADNGWKFTYRKCWCDSDGEYSLDITHDKVYNSASRAKSAMRTFVQARNALEVYHEDS